ncbi:hypothetical protein [Flavobacterium sp. N1994]|uniref:hypothetical protein n=1 Tax=Flavobacterium sp. N1994 TaxID=2986827 RepID=UPI002221C12E|nr:hypothetical protein [Flavobacterium sp. N1994]
MKYLSFIITLLATLTLSAQEVKLKKEIIYVSDTPTFSFTKKAMGNELCVYKLNTKEEIVTVIVDNNNTESKVDDSKKIVFTQQKTTIENKNFRSRTYEFLLSLLLEEKVIDLKGEINLDNLIRFKAKYDENNVNHTMMR